MNLPRYIPQFDALRGLAVSIVMLYHLHKDVPALHLHTLFRHGWVGVDLFFVLSGFLITGILVESKDSPRYLRNFYARRILRIWPLYFALLLVCFLLIPWVKPESARALKEACGPPFVYFLFLQNLFPTYVGIGPLTITWSLAIEEQFYLFWPLAVWRR